MKKIKTILAILPALLFSCAGDDVEKYIPPTPIAPSEPGEEVVYHKRAKEQFDLINQCYRINSGVTEGLYNENYPKKDGDNSASFLWPYDGLVSGAAALHALGYDVNYTDMVDRFDVYYRTSSGSVNVGGYGSSTNGTTGGGTRYYDDNSIVGIDLVEAYSLTNNQTYLTKAKQIVEFLKSGEDQVFGGGYGGMRMKRIFQEMRIPISRHVPTDMRFCSCWITIRCVRSQKKQMYLLLPNGCMTGWLLICVIRPTVATGMIDKHPALYGR